VNEFKKLLGINFDQYYEILKTTNQRRNMTNFLMNYFEFHISGFKRPNSLEILNGLFS
jgi:DNA repair protein RecO (recombination protein O)